MGLIIHLEINARAYNVKNVMVLREIVKMHVKNAKNVSEVSVYKIAQFVRNVTKREIAHRKNVRGLVGRVIRSLINAKKVARIVTSATQTPTLAKINVSPVKNV